VTDSLTISVGLDSSKLRADLAVVNDQIRATGTELRNVAKEFNTGNATAEQVQEVAKRYDDLRGRAGALQGAIRAVGDEHQAFGQKARDAFQHAREAGEQATSSVSGLVNVLLRLSTNPITLTATAIGVVGFAAFEAAKRAADVGHELTNWAAVLGVSTDQTNQWHEAALRLAIPVENLVRLQERFAVALEKSADAQRKVIVEAAAASAKDFDIVARGGGTTAATKQTSQLVFVTPQIPRPLSPSGFPQPETAPDVFSPSGLSSKTTETATAPAAQTSEIIARKLDEFFFKMYVDFDKGLQAARLPPVPFSTYEARQYDIFREQSARGDKLRDDFAKATGDTMAPALTALEGINRQMPGFVDRFSKLAKALQDGSTATANFVPAWNQFWESLKSLPSSEVVPTVREELGRQALDPNLIAAGLSGALSAVADASSKEAEKIQARVAQEDEAWRAEFRARAFAAEQIRAFGDSVLSTINYINRIAPAALGSSANTASAGEGLTAAGAAGIPGQASGGYITGPGTGTSDSIIARLSHGEYVLNAASTARLGTGYLDHLNSLGKYATGGLVGRISLPSFASGGAVSSRTPVILQLGNRNYHTYAEDSVADALIKAARSRQMLSAGARPS